MRRTLCGVLPEELEGWLTSVGQPGYRSKQILAWVHRRGVADPGLMTDLPSALRELLRDEFPPCPAEIVHVAASRDGTRKLLVSLAAGGAVETVLIPDESKLTQCISTQVGCAFRCAFCLSGSKGLDRDLTADEIMAQLLLARSSWNEQERLSNVVLMGSGEPLANYRESKRALELMTGSDAGDLSTRRVTVSTIGLPKGIRRLGEDFGGQIGLAVSLHGADDRTRARLLPKVKTVPIDEVLSALREYPLPRRRRITIEYVLVAGVNDAESQAKELSRRLAGLRVKVNLIPFNPHDACDLSPPSREQVERFQRVLVARGLTAIVRRERGVDIGAACGQLIAARAGLTDRG